MGCPQSPQKDILYAQSVARRQRGTVIPNLIDFGIWMVEFHGEKWGAKHAVTSNDNDVSTTTASRNAYGHALPRLAAH